MTPHRLESKKFHEALDALIADTPVPEEWARTVTRLHRQLDAIGLTFDAYRGKRDDGVISFSVEQPTGYIRWFLNREGRLWNYDRLDRTTEHIAPILARVLIMAVFGEEELDLPHPPLPLVASGATFLRCRLQHHADQCTTEARQYREHVHAPQK